MKKNEVRKKILSVALAAAMLCGSGAAAFGMVTAPSVEVSAAEVQTLSENGFEYTVTDNKAVVTKYIGSDGNITVPSKLGGFKVVGIGKQAFSYSSNVRNLVLSVNLPKTIQYISTKAFFSCKNLKSVNLFSQHYKANQTDLVYIGKSAFYGCTSLTKIDIPDSVVFIDNDAFHVSGKTPVEGTLVIGDSVATIGDSAFASTKTSTGAMTGIKLGDSLRYIGAEAFAGAKKFPGGFVFIPSTVTSIGIRAFAGIDGSSEYSDLYSEIEGLDNGLGGALENAMKIASGDYTDYYLVSTESNKAVSNYCSDTRMWDWENNHNQPAQISYEGMKNIPTVNKTSANTGDTIKITAQAGDAETPYKYIYRYYVKDIETGEYVYKKGFITANKSLTKSVVIDKAGIYNVIVEAYTVTEDDVKEKISTEYRKVVVADPIENNMTVKNSTTDDKIVINCGEQIKFNVQSAKGIGYDSAVYAVRVDKITDKGNSVSYNDRDALDALDNVVYKSIESFDDYIEFNSPGKYKVYMYVRDAAKHSAKKVVDVTVNAVLGSTVELDYKDNIINSSKFDNTQDSTFKFYYQKEGSSSRKLINSFTNKNTLNGKKGVPPTAKASFVPQSAGTYKLTIKRTQGDVVAEDSTTINVVDTISFSNDTINYKDSVTMIATNHSLENAKYLFWYMEPGSKEWKTIDNPKNETKIKFTPTKRGTYKLYAAVVAGNGEKTKKTATLLVDTPMDLSSETVKLGKSIGVNVSGSTLPNETERKYIHCYRKKGTEKWYVISNPNNKRCVYFNPKNAGLGVGEYEIKVKLKSVYDDGTTSTVTKYFNVTVTE